jgi:hypothetical protein
LLPVLQGEDFPMPGARAGKAIQKFARNLDQAYNVTVLPA